MTNDDTDGSCQCSVSAVSVQWFCSGSGHLSHLSQRVAAQRSAVQCSVFELFVSAPFQPCDAANGC